MRRALLRRRPPLQCALTGVSAAQYGTISANPANQYNGLFGGNANLTPEKADTITLGAIVQPRWIPGLALTADYFNIKIKNLIGAPTFVAVLNALHGHWQTADPTQCARIQRNPAQRIAVAGPERFRGPDQPELQWRWAVHQGLRLLGQLLAQVRRPRHAQRQLRRDLADQAGKSADSGVGRFAGSTPSPKWRHKLRVGFSMPNGLGLSGQWRYFSAVHLRRCGGRPGLRGEHRNPIARGMIAEAPLPGNQKLNAVSYFDLALTARITNKFNLRFGANNIFDRQPPLAGGQVIPAGFGNGNTFPQVYDALGRYMFAGVTVDF